jgi:GntR family transcriptional regulator, trigonelline degradation regulator
MDEGSLYVRAVAAPVRQQVIQTLSAAIATGRFKPGQRLIEKELCELMGVSRPSVREALRHLESEGLVETIPNRGPVVVTLTPEQAMDIYQIRGALEAFCARQLALHGTDEQIAALETALEKLQSQMLKGVDASLAAKDKFYEALVEGGGNSIIATILKTMNTRITMLRRISLSSADRVPHSLGELKALVDAVKARDADAAYRASFEHIERAAAVAVAEVKK